MKQTTQTQVTQETTEDVCDVCQVLVIPTSESITEENENYAKQGIVKGDVAYHLNCIRELDGKSAVL